MCLSRAGGLLASWSLAAWEPRSLGVLRVTMMPPLVQGVCPPAGRSGHDGLGNDPPAHDSAEGHQRQCEVLALQGHCVGY